jgi:ubiquitin-protein ligase E3 C
MSFNLIGRICKVAFDTNFGLFRETAEQLLYPSPLEDSSDSSQLECFEFIGRLIGKTLTDGILIDAPFASFFLSKWLARSNYCTLPLVTLFI